ncbi:MAG TPA: NAD-binding protein, partial [Hyphomicrobiales bacterium]|nr:NAD-binding protein [Hyphomicrobiales bacterium]
AGFGRVGHTLAATLDAEGVTYVGLDADPNNVTRARAEHRPVFYGDASRLAILNRAQIATAQAVVITMDAPETAERIVRQIRREWPLVPIYARARDGAHAARLVAAGATVAVPEAIEASLQLAGRVLAGLGASEEAVRRRLDQQRAIEETP